MAITLYNLPKNPASSKRRRRLGRGNASGAGTYSGRGNKGQRSRSGGKGGLKLKGLKRTILNLPKFKGQKPIRRAAQVVKLNSLNQFFKDGDKVTPQILQAKGLISKINMPVKILNNGGITIKLIITGCAISAAAKTAVEKAGGQIEPVRPRKLDKNSGEQKKKLKTK